jgi:BirA family biotin operon repressor/biotin-[acetyl-CoA-carboxylase] ligase
VGGAPGAKPTLSVVWRPAFLPAADQLNQPDRGAGDARLAPLLGHARARVKWPERYLLRFAKLGGILV